MMDKDQIELLANFFVGNAVAINSMNLDLYGPQREASQEFFAVRKSFGIEGYASKDDAVRALVGI